MALAMQGCLCQPRSSSLDPRLTNPGLAPLYIKECPVSCPTGPLFPAHPTGLPLHISGLSWATSPKPRKGRVPSQGVAGKGVQLWACVPQAALHMLKEDTCLGGQVSAPHSSLGLEFTCHSKEACLGSSHQHFQKPCDPSHTSQAPSLRLFSLDLEKVGCPSLQACGQGLLEAICSRRAEPPGQERE